jgi:hypothetical protein
VDEADLEHARGQGRQEGEDPHVHGRDAARRERLALDVYAHAAKRLAHAAGKKRVSASARVCGQRTLEVRVKRLRGAGAFRLAISTP